MADAIALCIGGTGESYAGDERREVTGALTAVVNALHPTVFRGEWVGYSSTYANKMSYAQSVQDGVNRVLGRIAALKVIEGEKPIVLLGYSQGAAIATKIAEMVNKDPMSVAMPVIGVGTLGSPAHNPINAVPGKKTRDGHYGISGKAIDLSTGMATRLCDMVVPGDPIAEIAQWALLRDVADFTEYMSLSSPDVWADQTRRLIKSRGFQNAARRRVGPLGTAILVSEAAADLRRYLPYTRILNPLGGRHTAYTTEMAVMNGVKKNFTWAAALGFYLNHILLGEELKW